jgi:putative transposon-encoded protein
MDIRCPHRKFGEVTEFSGKSGRIEIACPSRWCGKRTGVVVIHTFNLKTGELIGTRQFRSPKGDK